MQAVLGHTQFGGDRLPGQRRLLGTQFRPG
jgi:hypothetical protein